MPRRRLPVAKQSVIAVAIQAAALDERLAKPAPGAVQPDLDRFERRSDDTRYLGIGKPFDLSSD
jgi:hypothetical protein